MLTDLRPMTVEDLEANDVLERHSFPHPWPLEAYREWLAEAGHHVFVCYDGTVLAAMGAIDLSPPAEAYIDSIAVASSHQRRGLGRRVLAHLLREARTAAKARVLLEVAADNAEARGLYRSCGFREHGVVADYYGPGEAALQLSLAL